MSKMQLCLKSSLFWFNEIQPLTSLKNASIMKKKDLISRDCYELILLHKLRISKA